MAGGIVLSIGNLSSQYVWAFLGLSVAGVITSSIIVVIGISSHSHHIPFLFILLYIIFLVFTTVSRLLDRLI